MEIPETLKLSLNPSFWCSSAQPKHIAICSSYNYSHGRPLSYFTPGPFIYFNLFSYRFLQVKSWYSNDSRVPTLPLSFILVNLDYPSISHQQDTYPPIFAAPAPLDPR